MNTPQPPQDKTPGPAREKLPSGPQNLAGKQEATSKAAVESAIKLPPKSAALAKHDKPAGDSPAPGTQQPFANPDVWPKPEVSSSEHSAPEAPPVTRIPKPPVEVQEVEPKRVLSGQNPLSRETAEALKRDPHRQISEATGMALLTRASDMANASRELAAEVKGKKFPTGEEIGKSIKVKQTWFSNLVAFAAGIGVAFGLCWYQSWFAPNRTFSVSDQQLVLLAENMKLPANTTISATTGQIEMFADRCATKVTVPKVDIEPVEKAVKEATAAVTEATKVVTESTGKPVSIKEEQFSEIANSVKELFASLEKTSSEKQDALASLFTQNMAEEIAKLKLPNTAEIAKATSRATWDMATTGIQRDGTSDGTVLFSLQKGPDGEAAFRWEKAEEPKPESKTAAAPSGQ